MCDVRRVVSRGKKGRDMAWGNTKFGDKLAGKYFAFEKKKKKMTSLWWRCQSKLEGRHDTDRSWISDSSPLLFERRTMIENWLILLRGPSNSWAVARRQERILRDNKKIMEKEKISRIRDFKRACTERTEKGEGREHGETMSGWWNAKVEVERKYEAKTRETIK